MVERASVEELVPHILFPSLPQLTMKDLSLSYIRQLIVPRSLYVILLCHNLETGSGLHLKVSQIAGNVLNLHYVSFCFKAITTIMYSLLSKEDYNTYLLPDVITMYNDSSI